MLSRTLLYTALTRARKLVVLVGQTRALSLAIRDWRQTPRHTALAGLLQGTMNIRWLRAIEETGMEEREDDPSHWEGLMSSDLVA
jgi:hypothetical protein